MAGLFVGRVEQVFVAFAMPDGFEECLEITIFPDSLLDSFPRVRHRARDQALMLKMGAWNSGNDAVFTRKLRCHVGLAMFAYISKCMEL